MIASGHVNAVGVKVTRTRLKNGLGSGRHDPRPGRVTQAAWPSSQSAAIGIDSEGIKLGIPSRTA
jgi:hypothetical protein